MFPLLALGALAAVAAVRGVPAQTAPKAAGAAATPETSPSQELQVTGYSLYIYAPPGWHWLERKTGGRVAEASVGPKGHYTLSFAVPVASLPGLMPGRFRFGVAVGFTANGPTVWVRPGKPFVRAGHLTPLGGPVLGQAALLRAETRVGGGMLRARMVFASAPVFTTAWDLMGLIDADGDPNTGYHGAEWLLQNCPLGSTPGPGLKIPWLVVQPGIIVEGHAAQVTAWLLNDGPKAVGRVEARLVLPMGRAAASGGHVAVAIAGLKHGEAHRLRWTVMPTGTGPLLVRLVVTSGGKRLQATRWVTAVAHRDPRREFETQNGDWLLYPPRPTLQEGDAAPLGRIKPLPSSALKHNLFGITAQLPRSVDDEDPFLASHAIDGDPATCWASRWWRVSVPLRPEWLMVDLGRARVVKEARFLPAWHNSGVPASFVLEASADRRHWTTVARSVDYHLQTQPAGSALRVGDLSWQRFPFAARRVRYLRLTATRLNQGGTGFFCAPFEPFQLRVAEMVAVGEDGAVLRPVSATASTMATAWYNTPETVTKTWPLELASGVKINRIGQWGDRTDWASVERRKGVYHIPAEVDRAITQSVKAGVDIELTLAYGNNLYQRVKNAPDFGPGWRLGHPFEQCAPTTPAAVAAFARYCGFMARHFRGRVKYFEIWNEEDGWFFDDWKKGNDVSEVRAYGRALKAAAQAVKKADPEAKVVFGGTAGSTLDYPRIALAEGAGPWVDIFAFHPYGHPTPEGVPDNFLTRVGDKMEWRPRPKDITSYETEIAAFRRLVHRYNPKMQVWADEMNWFAPGQPPEASLGDQSELTQAKHLSRFYAINAWLGCGAVWWSLYNANWVQEWAVVRSTDMTPRAAYYAAQYTATVLDDVSADRAVRAEVVGKAPPDLMVKVYRNGKGQVLVGLWRTSFGDDSCRPEPVTVKVTGLPAKGGKPGARGARTAKRSGAEIFDLLYGTRQAAVVARSGGGVTLRALLVGDWPIVVRLP